MDEIFTVLPEVFMVQIQAGVTADDLEKQLLPRVVTNFHHFGVLPNDPESEDRICKIRVAEINQVLTLTKIRNALESTTNPSLRFCTPMEALWVVKEDSYQAWYHYHYTNAPRKERMSERKNLVTTFWTIPWGEGPMRQNLLIQRMIDRAVVEFQRRVWDYRRRGFFVEGYWDTPLNSAHQTLVTMGFGEEESHRLLKPVYQQAVQILLDDLTHIRPWSYEIKELNRLMNI